MVKYFSAYGAIALAFASIPSLTNAFSTQARGLATTRSTAIFNEIGAGGMADTRNPDAQENDDPRKSISAAPSFEEYLKQRAVVDAADATAAAAPAPAAAAPVAAAPAAAAGGGGGAAAAIAAMDASQSTSVASIASAIPDLASKPDLCWEGTIAGQPGRLDARDAPGSGNIAWLSNLCIDSALSSLAAFCGPLTDVPHLISRCAVVDDASLSFFLDFRPRGYGAYEMRDAEGNYPGPDVLGRKAFEYSGNRKDFDTKFGDEEVAAFMASTLASFESAVEAPATTSELELLTRGPLALEVTMPLSDANVAAVIAAREQAATYWSGWATDGSHDHRPGAPVNSQYVYDTKYKQNTYGVLLDVYSTLYGGADGANLAAFDSGPLDEGYVGGGS